MNSEKQYIDLYQQCRTVICDHSSDVMNAVRDQAFEDFRRLGFPTKQVERYKYTDIPKLFEPDYGVNLNRLEIPVNPYDAFSCDLPNLSTLLYFVVNDQFYRGQKSEVRGDRAGTRGQKISQAMPALPDGVVIGSLRDIFSNPSPLTSRISPLYAKLAKTGEDAVTALNTMLSQDGLLVYVPKKTRLDRAVQVINILKSPFTKNAPSEGRGGLMVNRRVIIVLEEGAEAKILFCDHTADDRDFLATQVIEAYVADNASLELYCLEETHAKNARVSNVYIEQQRNSRVHHHVLTLHNGITRNRLDLTLKGEGAECFCNGCVIADKSQHVDNNTLIDHQASHCASHELYKYVLGNQATGAFAGRVLVRKDSQKTESEMRNQNLCTTRKARMYTQPMLEIYADDVKCSHGSTVGQLNDAALFYMRQRGIGEREARLLLETAFINEVIEQITLEPLRDRLRYLVEKRFRGELNKCEGCKLCK